MLCPICKSPVSPPQPNVRGPYPFCSERCKLIDLGRWLDGKYQIPVKEDETEDPAFQSEPQRDKDSESE